MFKNPLKYQQGGAAPSQQEQQMLAAFIQWLPKRVKEFQGMQPEQIAQTLDGMSKTPEGKKQLQQLMTQFQQEMQGGSQAFRQGGKIHDFICKHAKGGSLKGCGCKQEGGSIRPGFEYLGENVLQDKNNPNFFEVISNGYRVNGQDVAVPTRSGAYRMGIDKDNPGAWDGGQRIYNQDQFNNIRNFYEDLLPNANKVQGPKERLAGMECGGKVAKALDGSDGIPQAKNAKAARRAASKNTVSVGNSGRAKNRKIGAATDKFGGQHLYEDSVIDGSWSDVYVDVPHPGDTIVTQSFPVANGNDSVTRTYPMGSEQYESVMSRMRPAFRMFFPQHKCGGKIKKAQDGNVLDYYSNKWDNDLARIKQGWNRFKESAPGKVWSAFMPNPNSENGMLGAAAPIGKIKYIPEGVSGTKNAAKWVAENTPQTPHIATFPPKQVDETQGAKVINGLREWLYGKRYNGR